MATNELSMKLLINTKTNKLCFAEASSDVVEFLTSLLSLPLGTVTSLLDKESTPGSVGSLLGSAEKLDANYNTKKRQLSPAVASATLSRLKQLLGSHLSNGYRISSINTDFYTCDGGINVHTGELSSFTSEEDEDMTCDYLSATYGNTCPSCGKSMENSMTLPARANGPAAAGATPTYTVKDDLSVTPASLSLITLLADCGVTDLSVLQQKTVKIGKEEALGILATALKSKTVLTDVFMQETTS